MADSSDSVRLLRDSIRDGSFPDSNELLTTDLDIDVTPSLLSTIRDGQDILKAEIKEISKGQAGDVDEWIAQAKKVQDDIARCKTEARYIVQEHERVEAMRTAVREASSTVQLLEGEIAFSKALEHELQMVGEVSQVLNDAGDCLSRKSPAESANRLASTTVAISRISSGRTSSLLIRLEKELRQKTRQQLQEILDARLIIDNKNQNTSFELVDDNGSKVRDEQTSTDLSMDSILQALTQLDALPDGVALLLRKIEAFILPVLASKHSTQPASATVMDSRFQIDFGKTYPDVDCVLQIVEEFVGYLHTQLPTLIQNNIAKQLVPKMISSLVSNWLNTAIPYELEEVQKVESVRKNVTELASLLSQYAWPGSHQLNDWIDQIPRTWLAKRRVISLDTVRQAFAPASMSTRQVERMERQVISKDEAGSIKAADEGEDWNANWDDEVSNPVKQEAKSGDDENASGWDFELEDDHDESADKDKPTSADNEGDDDAGDAWGWGDESPTEAKQESQSKTSKQINGLPSSTKQEHEMVLRETYTITDVPDHVLNIIKKDIHDSQMLQSAATAYFRSPPTAGVQSLPTLVLAMYRATAPTYYSSAKTLSNMNLYNDALYIVQKLEENSDPTIHSVLSPGIQSMSKFARQTWTRELDLQRTILSDLLDDAQGFVSCTRFPYSQACANAITSVVDRIREVHKEWKHVLGQSHLAQSIGSLINMVMLKMIHDVEDMDDISEAESKQLVEFCQSISSLEDLFVVSQHSQADAPSSIRPNTQDEGSSSSPPPMSTIAVHVPKYFRFQYLIQVLESSLVDIKYLWTEGQLSFEFTADEVVDLIKALFSESSHRRNAINAIRA